MPGGHVGKEIREFIGKTKFDTSMCHYDYQLNRKVLQC